MNITSTAVKSRMYFQEDIVIIIQEKLDIEAMRDATRYLIGPKNFTSFTDDKECKDPVRKITNIKIVRSGEKVRITYYGTGFLYHMVRMPDGNASGDRCEARGMRPCFRS